MLMIIHVFGSHFSADGWAAEYDSAATLYCLWTSTLSMSMNFDIIFTLRRTNKMSTVSVHASFR